VTETPQAATSAKSLGEMMAEVVAATKAKGWYDTPVSFGEAMALLHSEVSEALEAWREWGTEDAIEAFVPGSIGALTSVIDPPKPEGVGSEFADVLIRLLDYCSRFDVDLAAEYERKMRYNRTRPYRHGGKPL
jgi:NTP pyrophosphatase (non-canonical NTP hydrolase)